MVYERIPWEDRFNRPTTQQLRAALSDENASAFDAARKFLKKLNGVEERVTWYGHCWRWSIEYRKPGDSEPLGVLIPSPSDLQLAMPLDTAFVETLPISRMKRSVRDGLELAQAPFDTRWGVWSIQYGQLLDDLRDLFSRRLKHRHQVSS
jgi:hypothetical protein